MAERGLDHWDVVVANLREVLETYINLGDREIIVRTFTEFTDALFFAGRLHVAVETARRGLTYLTPDVSADLARVFAALGQDHALAARDKPPRADSQEPLNI